MAKFFNVLAKALKIIFAAVFLFLVVFSVGRECEKKLFNKVVGSSTDNERIAVTFIDVNQADCALISFSDKWVLIDCGGYMSGKLLDRYFQKLGIECFEAVFITHPDADHYGGMVYLKDKYKIKKFYQPDIDLSEASEDYIDIVNSLEEHFSEINYLVSGDELKIDEVRFSVLGPVYLSEETNDMSLVMKVTCGGFSSLFCGDMSEDEINDILAEHSGKMDSDVIKIAHHGSATGTTEELLDEVSPKYAIISVGENTYNLPNYKVMELLSQYDLEVLTTKECGDIKISYNGKYIIQTERK